MSELPSFRSALNGFNRSDVISFIKETLDKNAQLSSDLAQAQQEMAELRSEIEEYQKQIEAYHAERQNEQLLGKAMYDARRFSDTIVQEANDKANEMLDNAAETAENIALQVEDIAAQAGALSEYFGDTMTNINDQLAALNITLRNFNKDAIAKKEPDIIQEHVPERLTVRKVKRKDGNGNV